VIQDALAALQTASRPKRRKPCAAVKEQAATLFASPRQVVLGNPHGDVTYGEVLDYKLRVLQHALSDMLE